MTQSNRIWIAGTVILSIGILALGWLLGVSPKLDLAAKSHLETAQVDLLNDSYRLKLAEMRTQFENMPALEAELAEMQAQFPPQAEYSVLLSELNGLAAQHELGISAFTLGAPTLVAGSSTPTAEVATTDDGTAAPPTPSASTSVAPDGSVVSVPISITLGGPLSDVTAFVGDVQSAERLILVTNVEYTASSDDGSVYSLKVDGFLYVLVDSSQEEAGQTADVTPTPAP